MARISLNFRFFTAILAALVVIGQLTACSKDSKKGTPVSEKSTSGAYSEGQISTEQQTNSNHLNARGSDQDFQEETQVSSSAPPANASQQPVEEQGTSLEIRTTPISELTLAPTSNDSSLANPDSMGLGGELTINRSNIGDYYQDLVAMAPDYNNVHIRANHRDYPPITTLGTDSKKRFDFTDYSDDILLNTALRLSMKTSGGGYSDISAGDNDFLPQEFFNDSQTFAANIKDIRSQVTPYIAGQQRYSIATVKVVYEYEGTNREIDFYGIVNENTRQVELAQVTPTGRPAPEHDFQGYLTCMDTADAPGGKCTNSILVIEQVAHGKICKRVFAVLRHMHVGISINRDDYRSYFDEVNPQKRAFLQYLVNTAVTRRYSSGYYVPEDGDDLLLTLTGELRAQGQPALTLPSPFMERVTTRTFAIAHGYGETELLMRESDYDEHHPRELSNPSLKDHRKDVFRLVGPLARAIPLNNKSALIEIDGFIQDEVEAWVRPNQGEPLYSNLVSSAEIVGNDGRGTIEVKYNFGSNSSLMVVYKANNVNVRDPRSIRLYPYQGRQAPENITKDMMPLPFF